MIKYLWRQVKKSDPVGVALANRHYSRILFGTQGVALGPPGRLFCLVSCDGMAVWVSHWPYAHLALDGLDSYRCTMFRNEGIYRSSNLILGAMELTQEYWGGVPADEWVTWVAPEPVKSVNPGYCFKVAGWWHDREWRGRKRGIDLIRLRSHGIPGQNKTRAV